MSGKAKKVMKYFLFIITLISFLLTLLFIYQYREINNSGFEKSINAATVDINKGTELLDNEISKIMSLADNLAHDLNKENLDSLELLNRLKAGCEKYPEVFGFGVGFEYYEYSKNRRLYAPFYIKPNDDPVLTFVDTSYDYTQRGWYSRPRDNGKAWFEPPYYGIVAKTFIAEYSVPIIKNDSSIGIVYIDISFEKLINIINKVSVGKSGYGFLLSKTGNYIVHPINEWVKSEKNITDFAKEVNDDRIIELFNNGSYDEHSYIQISNPVNGLNSTMMLRELSTNGWKFGIMFLSDDFKANQVLLYRKLLFIIIFVTLFLILSVLSILFINNRTDRKYWIATGFISLIFSLAIWAVWLIKMNEPFYLEEKDSNHLITDRSVLDKFLQNQDSIDTTRHNGVSVKIPTGVFIEHIEFVDANTIRFSGFVWQKYDEKFADNINIRPFFPETSPDAEALSIQESYRKTDNGIVTVGWYFRVAIRQKVDFVSYPFDRQDLKLRIWPSELSKNFLLTPDLESYSVSNPSLLPGIEENLVLRGWKSEASYFNYEMKNYNTTFGVKSKLADRSRNDMSFNIVVERKFLGPFVTHIIPLIVISIFLFTIVMSTSNKENDQKLGFSGFGVLEICAAFYFVVILAHIDFRNFLGVQQVIYLDYFYFLVYIKILVYAVNNVLYSKYTNIKFIQERNNLYPRLLYWPLYLGLIFIITCFVFY